MENPKFIPIVLDSVGCKKHNAIIGVPCFHIPKMFGYNAGVCGKRIKASGFVGKVSPDALLRSKSKKGKRHG